jgi:hypothetical protein
MVHTITPVVNGERTKGYWLTVVLYSFGATGSAAAFGAALGTIGGLVRMPWGPIGVALVFVAAVIYAVRELADVPVPIFDRRRQVPEWWREFYSRPVAALLYGVSLGIGFLTFLTFGSFVVVSAAAIASGSPAAGAGLCGAFGVGRGLALIVGASSSAQTTIEGARGQAGARLANGGVLVCVAILAGQALNRAL